MLNFSKSQMVLFADGCTAMLPVFLYDGAALAGDPTAYVRRKGQIVWVKPGDSVEWVEAAEAAAPVCDQWGKPLDVAAIMRPVAACQDDMPWGC